MIIVAGIRNAFDNVVQCITGQKRAKVEKVNKCLNIKCAIR